MVKVIYFLNTLARGGVEEHVLRLIENLDKDRFEPVLVCPREVIDLIRDEIERLMIKVYSVRIRGWRRIGQINKFFRILKAERPDIVHTHLFQATMYAAPLAKMAGVPFVLETAHIREAWRRGIKKAYFIDRFFYGFVDKIIAVSHSVKDYLVDEKRVSPGKIKVIQNGVDVDIFTPESGIRYDGRLHIGVIGRLEAQKGHRYFLEAISALGDRGDEAEFFIIGEGSLEQDLKARSKRLGIEHRIQFLGYRSDIRNVIKDLDIVVLPSLFEGLPLVVLEASAMEKPVIVTDVDGNREAVIHGKTGLVVPAGDAAALMSAIERLIDNRDFLRKLGQNGREYVCRCFGLDRQVNDTMAEYMDIVKNRSPRSSARSYS
ncbi:MAG: glycosyltransferase family 4 protein [Candidatus Omnitrophota bacterium]